MAKMLTGQVYEHRRTKELLQYIPKQAIALIWHEDLDGVAVDGLLQRGVKAVVNGRASMSGKYYHTNVQKLIKAGVPVFDMIFRFERWERFMGEQLVVLNDDMYVKKDNQLKRLASLKRYDENEVAKRLEQAVRSYPDQLTSFVNNTIEYAQKECSFFVGPPNLPPILQRLNGHEVLIVARSPHYVADLKAVRTKLKRKNVLILAVDGAADGLLRIGLTPDFIIGDMDSISEAALTCGATLLCHQYIDGGSPGQERLKTLAVKTETITFVGTSEDVAISAAYWSGAAHLYLIGCRLGMNEFLEKGRAGMGSSMLSRIQAGDRMTDLKGIHRLVQPKWRNDLSWKQWFRQAQPFQLWRIVQSMLSGRMAVWKRKGALRHE